MKSLKIISLLLLLLSFIACRRNDENKTSKPIKDLSKTFDITKYAIIGKRYYGSGQIPFIIAFKANGNARYEMPGDFMPYSYTYKDGILTLDQMGGNLIRVRLNQ